MLCSNAPLTLFWMYLDPAMSFGNRSASAEREGQGEVGRCTQRHGHLRAHPRPTFSGTLQTTVSRANAVFDSRLGSSYDYS